MRVIFQIICVWVAIACTTFPTLAVNPDEILDDPVLELRARELSKELRCLVCQNQSIDDSDAELAKDLRVLVRERLLLGESDTDVIEYVVERYGEFVLLRPVLGLHTLVLWVATPLLFLLGFVAMYLIIRRRDQSLPAAELSSAEEAALASLMENQDDGNDKGGVSG